jgi:hypothetical protein
MAKSGTAKFPYETDNGNIFFVRGDDASTLDTIRGTEPTGEPTENLTFEFTKNSLEVGCKPRSVTLVRQVTDPNAPTCLIDDFGATKEVVVLTRAHFNTLKTGKSGTTVTYSGQQYRVKTKTFEQMR